MKGTEDGLTGAFTEVELVVDLSVEQAWALVTDVGRTGEWSPECVFAAWRPGGSARVGARFDARNEYGGGFVATVECVVTEAVRPSVFAWAVLDDAREVDRPGSLWRYELTPAEGGGTRVRQRFTHGPGVTGLRVAMEEHAGDARTTLEGRLAKLRANMSATLRAMLTPSSGRSPSRT